MKKYVILLIISCFLILPGCARKDSYSPQPSEAAEQQIEQVSENLQQLLGMEDDQLNDISVTQVQTYEDETIVRYVQTYRGVEIYGSSMVATSADEEFFGGTYYDLTDAFGEDFDTQVEETATVPEWMQSTESVFVDTESLHPVIYITPEHEAILCRCFFVEIYLDGVTERVEVVTDISGRELYEFNPQDQKQYYSPADVQGSSGRLPVVEENGIYYAYNDEYNFYAAYKVFETSDDVDIDDFSRDIGGKLKLVGSSDLIYSAKSDDWSNGDAALIACAMETFYDVAAWYDHQFGYNGLDGHGGLGAVASSLDYPDTWSVQCTIGECCYTINYHGYSVEDEGALPFQVFGQDFRKEGKKMAIADVLRTGMTYEEIAKVADVPKPYQCEVGWTTSFYMNYYFVTLFFEGDAEPGELYSAEISPKEEGVAPPEAANDVDANTAYLLDYCTANYAAISEAFEYSYYTNPDLYGDGGNVWNCTCMNGQGLSLVFDFASDYEDPAAVPIYARIDDFMYWSGSTTGAELCPGLAMGMSYGEAALTLDLTELDMAPEQTWTEPVYLAFAGDYGCSLELYFVGSSEDTAVLVSVNATPIG